MANYHQHSKYQRVRRLGNCPLANNGRLCDSSTWTACLRQREDEFDPWPFSGRPLTPPGSKLNGDERAVSLRSDQITLRGKEAFTGVFLTAMAFKGKSVNGTNTLSSSVNPPNHREITRRREDTACTSLVVENPAEKQQKWAEWPSCNQAQTWWHLLCDEQRSSFCFAIWVKSSFTKTWSFLKLKPELKMSTAAC